MKILDENVLNYGDFISFFYYCKLSGDQKENFHIPHITEFSLYFLHSTVGFVFDP